MTRPTADEVRAEVLRELLSLAPMLDHVVSEGLRSRRLTHPRARLLLRLHDAGSVTMSDLSRALDVTPRAITTLVDGLEGAGLVRRTPHPCDRRATVIALTSSGRRVCREMRVSHYQFAQELLGSVSSRDLSTSLETLSTVRGRLEPG